MRYCNSYSVLSFCLPSGMLPWCYIEVNFNAIFPCQVAKLIKQIGVEPLSILCIANNNATWSMINVVGST